MKQYQTAVFYGLWSVRIGFSFERGKRGSREFSHS